MVWTLIVATLGAAAMAVYTYRGYLRAATDLVIQRDGQVALLSAARLSAEMGNFTSSLYTLARSPKIVEGTPRDQGAALADAALRMVVFDGGVVLLDNHGIVTGAVPKRPDIVGSDWADRETFRQVLLKSDSYISDTNSDGPDGARVVSIGVPILGPNSEFRGALVGMFTLSETARSSLYASIVRLRLGQSGQIVVTDGTDLVIYSTVPEQVGRVFRPPELPPVNNAPGAGAGRLKTADGVDVVSAFAPVPATGWTLVTQDDWSSLTASTRRYRDLFLASLIVVGLLPAIGAAVLSRQRRLGFNPMDKTGGVEGLMHAIHTRVTPRQMPMLPGWSMAQRHRLMSGARRDFWDSAILKDGRLMLALGRVEPVGLDTAVALTATRTMWRDAVERLSDPCEALERANRVLCSGFSESLRVNCIYALVDPVSGALTYAVAGQSPPLISGQGSKTTKAPISNGLGRRLDSIYEASHAILTPGTALVLLSQPMREARGQDKRDFATACLPGLIEKSMEGAEALAESLIIEFIDFTRRSPYAPPEISCLVLERLPSETD